MTKQSLSIDNSHARGTYVYRISCAHHENTFFLALAPGLAHCDVLRIRGGIETTIGIERLRSEQFLHFPR